MDINDSEPEIDFDHLNQYVGGDISLTKEIFGLFKNQVDIWAKQLQADADDEIWSAVTHSLKGSARAIGAMKLAQACENAESLVGEGRKLSARQVAVDTLEIRIDRATIEIGRWEYRQTMNAMRS
ncbi:Hpt domain-containing protein [Fretibacter rubidus]|uniref:Hpt domain-containing protein n=1 Tax=Fretibacter rubidus TaxID=570162 RepID=UPI00352B70D4